MAWEMEIPTSQLFNFHYYSNVQPSNILAIIMFFTIFLLLNFLIPISLNILIEGIKTFSTIFLTYDAKMYDK